MPEYITTEQEALKIAHESFKAILKLKRDQQKVSVVYEPLTNTDEENKK